MKRFYITTSIAYVNAAPHIGYALEVIQADAMARYRRALGDSVFFATGTDEHGVKIARRAEELQKTPQALVDEYAAEFRALKDLLNLSWDGFIRTTDKKKHWPVASRIWNALYEHGDLYRKVYEGLYCVGHEAFITEKDIEGGVCAIHKKAPERIKEENWFFRFSKYAPRIKKLLERSAIAVIPETRKNEVLGLLKEGFEDVSFSRPRNDLSWGIPVPHDPTQMMYVWADALTNYLSVLDWSDKRSKLKTFWPADVHMIGKDILRFHALLWPAMLFAAGIKLPKKIFVHGFVTANGEKMSKSLGNVISPKELVEAYGTDAVRYYLLREIPSGEDGDFSYEKFKSRYNGDLANGLGNLVARVATIGEKVSPLLMAGKKIDAAMQKEIKARTRAYHGHMKAFRFHDALSEIWLLIHYGDRFINDAKPWSVDDRKKLETIIRSASYLMLSVAELLAPLLPGTADGIMKHFLLKKGTLATRGFKPLVPQSLGRAMRLRIARSSLCVIKKGANLFPRL